MNTTSRIWSRLAGWLAGLGLAAACSGGLAATPLADQPVFSSASVPGNLVLDLSVEFPTAIGAAHSDTLYVPGNTYLGYFNPDSCYLFKFVDLETDTNKSHFAPAAVAAGHTCVGANDHLWSGNYLNWAGTQTIDPFRLAMTGGYRVVDSPGLTLLEKAYNSGQGGNGGFYNFPQKTLTNATDVAGATPFTITGSGSGLATYVANFKQAMVVIADGTTSEIRPFLATYFNTSNLDYGGATPVLTRHEQINFDWTNASPKSGVVNLAFSARWVNASTVPTTGNYQFRVVHDDGARLWVNGNLVLDKWSSWGTDDTGNVSLTAAAAGSPANPLNIRLEYYQGGGPGQIQLLWKAPGQSTFTLYNPGKYMQLPVRAKVCDPTAPGGVEANCKAYANGNYKPEGLMQQYADRLRYGVFGYLNDSSLARDGAVLRARQKFIGLTYPVPGAADQTNAAPEWDASTGVHLLNPDSADATDTSNALGITIANSGALNYINKFGEVTRGSYKTYDPVGELYYASLRYYRNLGNVPAWSSMAGADVPTRTTWADGFPVITKWPDPIQYTCQRNFVLGIGDVNSHADKNVPGSTDSTSEPTMPAEVAADTSVNAVTATNKVGTLQGISNLAGRRNYPDCCTDNAPFMAGLAYDANTKDIRPDLANVSGTVGQTVQTFWVDVLEGGFKASNQYYLAAKYGGFKAPTSFDPYSASAALQDNWWRTNTDMVGSQPRPDNYFTAGRPDLMISGLTKAFAQIAAQLTPFTTSFSSALPQVALTDTATYSAQYDTGTWTGELSANTSSFDPNTGNPVITNSWLFSEKLSTQIAGTGWDTNRRVATWNIAGKVGVPFRAASVAGASVVPSAQMALLDTVYRSGDDSSDYLKYLRGDRTQEEAVGTASSPRMYRSRSKLVGDIVNARPRVVGPPSAPFSSAANPGYTDFKNSAGVKDRTAMVYAGSNAGMLHAVNATLTGADAGREVFAYVPGALYQGPTGTPVVNGLQSVGDPDFTHHYMVDGPQQVFDIDLSRTKSGAGDSRGWRSVLVGALGKGGKGYYAIDVTDPASMTSETAVAAKVLWEFKHDKLGYTYGEPAAVKTRKYGWVLVFGSGYNNSDGQGYFFLVDPRNGELLQDPIPTGQGSTSNDAGLAQVQAFVLDRTDNTADAIYAGDLLGNLWRLDVRGTGTYPAPVQLAQLKDAADKPLPITSRPLVVVQPGTNRRFVTVGTGRLLASSDIGDNQSQAFFAIIDGNAMVPGSAATLPRGASYPLVKANLRKLTDLTQKITLDLNTEAGWWFDLGNSGAGLGWRTISDSTSFNGIVAFTSMLPSTDPCNPAGVNRVYAIDLGTGESRLLSGANTVAYVDTVPGVISDLRFYSVNGKARLMAGNDKGGVQSLPGKWTGSTIARRLNWRELLLAD